MSLHSCAASGHRPTRFKWKYKEDFTGCKRIKKRLHDQMIELYGKGVREFWIGGGQGPEMWAGEILLRLKEEPEYADIVLNMALPFEDHDKMWDPRNRERLAFLKRHSTKVVTVSSGDTASAEKYRACSVYLVDQADCLLAVYDDDKAIQSEITAMVSYAEDKGIPITLIHPDKGTVIG